MPGREGHWVAAGYSGHGNILGFACGDLVAGAILGLPPPELALSIQRACSSWKRYLSRR